MAEEDNRKSHVVVELGTESNPILIRSSTDWGRYSPFDSYLIKTPEGWISIDPERPDAAASATLLQMVSDIPIATLLTSDGHERSCYEIREHLGVPIYAPEYQPAVRAPVEYEEDIDHIYKEGDNLPGGIKPIKVNGAWGGDHALIWEAPTGQRFAFTGDIVNGQVETKVANPDHYRSRPGLAFGSRPGYMERHGNPLGMKESIQRLIDEDLDCICGSHGKPHWINVKEELARLRDSL